MSENIEQIMQRTRAYWYEDGFAEIAVGGLFALVGGFVYLQSVTAGTPLVAVISIGMTLLILGGSFLVKRVVNTLKERVTYPRTGYVAYDEKDRAGSGRWFIVGFAFVLAVATLIFRDWVSNAGLEAMSTVAGLLIAAIFGAMGASFRIRRFYIIAVAAVVIGAAASISGLGDVLGMAVFFAMIGMLVVISGVFALTQYLRAAGPPQEAQ